jgi:hypothetical protein
MSLAVTGINAHGMSAAVVSAPVESASTVSAPQSAAAVSSRIREGDSILDSISSNRECSIHQKTDIPIQYIGHPVSDRYLIRYDTIFTFFTLG